MPRRGRRSGSACAAGEVTGPRSGTAWLAGQGRTVTGDRSQPRGLPGAQLCGFIPQTLSQPQGGDTPGPGDMCRWPAGLGKLRMAASHDRKVTHKALPVPAPCWAPGQGDEQGSGAGGQSPHPEPLPGGREGCGRPGKASLHSPGGFQEGSDSACGSWCQAPRWAMPRIQLGVRAGLGSGDARLRLIPAYLLCKAVSLFG